MLVRIDARELQCPMPLLKAKLMLRRHPEAEGVKVLTTDPASARDFGVYAEHAGLTLVCEEADEFTTLILYMRDV